MQETKDDHITKIISKLSFGALGVLPLVIAPFVSNGVVKMTVFLSRCFLCALFGCLHVLLMVGYFLKHPIALLAWTLPRLLLFQLFSLRQ